jgi:signal transduction histidine kinase
MTTAPPLTLHSPLQFLEQAEAQESDERLQDLASIALTFAASLDLSEVLEHVTQHIAQLFGGVCRVRFTPAQRPAAQRRVVAGPNPGVRARDGLGVDDTYAALLARLSEPAAAAEAPEQPDALPPERRTAGGAALLFAPLIARGNRIGSLDVVIPAPSDGAVVRNQRLLRAIAAHAALAIDTADRFAQLQPHAPAADGTPPYNDPGPMLAMIAHDLRSPLTTLSASMQTLDRIAKNGCMPEQAQILRLTNLAGAAVAQLHAQIEALTPDPDLNAVSNTDATQTVDLVKLTRLLANFYQQTTGRHTFTLSADVAELPTPLTRAHAERVLSNLFVNGIKYSPVGGEIAVALSYEQDVIGRWATLSVRNCGIGIPPQDLPSLCQEGYRARNVGAIPGTGFGLVSVREIVEQYGGTFAIQSVVGETTTVRIRLPLAASSAR